MAGNFININLNVKGPNQTGSAGALDDVLSKSKKTNKNKIDNIKLVEEKTKSTGEKLGGAAIKAQVAGKAIDAAKQLATTTVNTAVGAAKFKASVGGNSAEANALNNTISGVTEGISSGMNVLNWAATGFSIGSAFGPWGMAIGAVAGTLIGATVELYDLITGNQAEIAEMKWQIQQQILAADKKARRLGVITTNRGRNGNLPYKL